MNKQSALEKLCDFKNLILLADEARDKIFFNKEIEKIDSYDKNLLLVMGEISIIFTSGLICLFLNEIGFLKESYYGVFLVLSVGLLFFGFVNYIVKKHNKKADACAFRLLEKLQEKHFLKNVNNVWDYNKKIKNLKDENFEMLSNDEDFIKVCLDALRKEEPEFVNEEKLILELAKPITEKKLKGQEYKEVLEKMYRVLNNEPILFKDSSNNNFQIVEES